MGKAPLVYVAIVVAATALFLLAPGIDLWASGLFYRPDTGFFLSGWPPVRALYRAVPWIVAAIIVGVPLAVFVGWWRGRRVFGLDLRAGLFVIATLAVGPGLLVNTVLKDHWGRARPTQVLEFGGGHRFTPAPVPAAECERNCSFVAGHPAVGFSLVAFAFLATGRRRRVLMVGALSLGTAIGAARIAQGGHFLSDVVFAGLIVYGVAALLHRIVIERDAGRVLWQYLAGRFGSAAALWILYAALTAAAIILSILYVDRPVALYFHGADPRLVAVFRVITRFGVSTYYLIGSAVIVLALRAAPLLVRPAERARRFTSLAAVPLFVFLSVAVSGLATDILKMAFGRARPKLLFANETFGFDWWGTRADFWSFPSGHATTIVAVAAALYFLWPRLVPLYAAAAAAVTLSRVIIGAHYVSDVIFAAFIAIAATAYIRQVFERSGIDLDRAKAGLPPAPSTLPWRVRLGLRALPRPGGSQ